LVFGKRAGEHAAKFAKEHAQGKVEDGQVSDILREALQPFDTGASGSGESLGPFQVQQELQDKMQDLVGIVRNEKGMSTAISHLEELKKKAANVSVLGNREFNPGWHTAMDLKNLLTVSEAITRAGLERKESRGGHFREDFPNKDAGWGQQNLVVRKGKDGKMELHRIPIPEMRPDLKQIIEEMK
jgi:succinate dehydrogenase / fumarate reductase flavoprotein subunit